MGNISPSAIRYFEKALDSKKSKSSRKRESSQTATITRVDEKGNAWFHIPGGAYETPAKYTSVDVAKGDIVNVTIQNGYARIDGNISSPAPSNRTVDKVTVTLREETQGIFEKLDAEKATIKELTVVKADIDDLEANTAHITNGVIDNAEIAHANVIGLTAAYAQINAANVSTATIRDAWVNQLLINTGLIAHEGTIFTLDAIQVDAANITAGTIDVQRLIVTVDGHKYMVHVDPETAQPTYQKLDGDVIQDLTITADKIVAGAITAQKITTENLVGTGGWINLRNGTFAYSNPLTGEGISWDGSHLTITGSVAVGGSSVSLSDVAEIATNTLIYDHTYEYNQAHTQATFTAHLYLGGVDVAGTTDYPASQFTWYYKNEDHNEHQYIGSGLTCTVTLANMGYGSHIIGKYTEVQNARLLTSNDDSLLTSEAEEMLVRTASGDSVRVSDLSVATVLYDTDKVMIVGGEDEHLVTMATLRGYLESTMAKQVRFGTTAEWSAQSSLVSEHGVLYVYTDHGTDQYGNSIAGIKAGDGNAYVVDLPFTDAVLTEHISDTTVHITAAERAFWNSKVRAYYAGTEQLVLTTS